MQNLLDKAIERYAIALSRRVASKAKMYKAEQEERASRLELSNSREDLRNLERELSDGIAMPGLIPSNVLHIEKSITS
jgi:hypothetical protein